MRSAVAAFAAIRAASAIAVAEAADAAKRISRVSGRSIGRPARRPGRARRRPRSRAIRRSRRRPSRKSRNTARSSSRWGLTPGGACVGYGMPSAMLSSGGYPMEWIQRPEQVTVIYEAHSEIRRIYIANGPAERTSSPAVTARRPVGGTATRSWSRPSALKEAVDQSSAHSDQAKIVERYTIGKDDAGRKVLTAEMTMTDPVFYSKPVSATKRWLAVENGRLLPYDCTEPPWEDQLDKLRQERGGEGQRRRAK